MSTFAIGDIQGCYKEFRNLLNEIKFNKSKDTLWLAGDLVNRGPNSFDVIKYVMDLESSAITVLGNHDFYLLASYYKVDPWPHKNNNFNEIIDDPNGDQIINWLKNQKMVHTDKDLGFIIAHAGIYPKWTLEDINFLSKNIEKKLQDKNCNYFLKSLWNDEPANWHEALSEDEKLIFAVNVFTRMRYLNKDLSLNLTVKANPNDVEADGKYPWFEFKNDVLNEFKMIIGHWSTLGYYEKNNFVSIDTGCAWGKKLTAIELKNNKKVKKYQVTC